MRRSIDFRRSRSFPRPGLACRGYIPGAGFTLAELLVTLAALGILAALLLPYLRPARETCCRPTCQSNLKQIGLGIEQYTLDYDDYFPLNVGGGPAMPTLIPVQMPQDKFKVSPAPGMNVQVWSWIDTVFPYLKSNSLFICPGDDTRSNTDPYPYPSYGYSAALGGYESSRLLLGKTDRQHPTARLGEVKRLAEVILACDFNAPESYRMTPADLQRYATVPDSVEVTPHRDGGNILYTDGHVKWMRREFFGHFATGIAACNLHAPDKNSQYCEKAFNPFLD